MPLDMECAVVPIRGSVLREAIFTSREEWLKGKGHLPKIKLASKKGKKAVALAKKSAECDTWVECDECGSWCKWPAEVPAPGRNDHFRCVMAPGYHCGMPKKQRQARHGGK